MSGFVVNVSAFDDRDKEGGFYRDYFPRAEAYHTTNFDSDKKGLMGEEDIYLDLEARLPGELSRQYDCVFNHTTLEHIYDIKTAFANLCELSRDIVVVVVPFLQEEHGFYGDYWRVTPSTVNRMFAENGFSTVYLSASDARGAAVYVFAVGRRGRRGILSDHNNILSESASQSRLPYVGLHAISNGVLRTIVIKARTLISMLIK